MKYLDLYKNTFSELNRLALLAFIMVLPYPHHAARICWVVFLISWLLSLQFLNKPDFRLDKDHILPLIPFAALILYFLWNLISIAWAGNKQLAWSSVERLINLFFVTIIAFFGLPKTVKWKDCLNMLVLTCVVSVAVYMFLYYWLHNIDRAYNKFSQNINIIDWLQVEEVTMHIKHRLQYSVLLCTAIPAVWFLHDDWMSRFQKGKTWLYTLLTVSVLLFGIYISGSRQTLITLAVVASTLIILFAGKHHRLVAMAAVTLFIVISAFLTLQFHPRFQDVTVKEMFSYEEQNADPSYEPRVAIWSTVVENWKEYSLYGVGTGNSAEYLTEKYKQKGWQEYAWRKFAPHNQYLTVWVELGALAMILFIALWLALPWCYKGKTRRMMLLFDEIIILTMCTESVFSRIEGIFFTCFILLLIPLTQHKN